MRELAEFSTWHSGESTASAKRSAGFGTAEVIPNEGLTSSSSGKMPAMSLKATDPAIKAYHAELQVYADHDAAHEGATETAFSRLLAVTAKPHGWTLIPKKGFKVGGKHIVPDGTLQDGNFLRRGYWEAKDTDDDLEVEITKKRKKGYPIANTIFEDTQRAVLYQNGAEAERYDLTKPQAVADLLNRFFSHLEPEHDNFETAIDDFKGRVPELAQGLLGKIGEAHEGNPKFQQAFDGFYSLCQTALNPNIRREAVDEMLIQHLLTERLFRKIFHDEEFTRRNVIAAEVETVIAALVGKSFSRAEFLKSLDKFYKAIERAAETIDDFADKQHFLNTVYERFFQGYSVKTADTHGIVYTPQPIVDFMCASVEEVLKDEFGLSLGSEEVTILDPCAGTGNFLVNLLRRVSKKDLPDLYNGRLFANEVMLLPYYIAALNIEHAYGELKGEYEPFEGLCFVDTLDMVVSGQEALPGFSRGNAVRLEKQRDAKVTVVIGNPPYNVGQLNENDNNKNRKYEALDKSIKATYAKASAATSVSKLNDPYVKFFRWATHRLNGRDGVVCFVTNNSFVDQIAFDGMRKHLLADFTCVYHLHLEGNVRQNPKLSGTQYNVFGIQVGVGITIAVKSAKHADRRLLFYRIDKRLRRYEKLKWLTVHGTMGQVPWSPLIPDRKGNWLIPKNSRAFAKFIPVGSKDGKAALAGRAEVLFKEYTLGIATHRDSVVYGFNKRELGVRVELFAEAYNSEVDRFHRHGRKADPETFAWSKRVVWDRDLKRDVVRKNYAVFDAGRIRKSLYRPFAPRWLYFDRRLNAEIYSIEKFYPNAASESENRTIVLSDIGCRSAQPAALCSNGITDLHLCATLDGHQCFPFYAYDLDGTNRRENITDWALKQYREEYQSKKLTKWDIFHYVYGLLHHPGYRAKFGDNLKKSLPRIPFAPDFWAFADAGKKLADLHLNYEEHEPFDLKFVTTPGVPLSYRVEKMKLGADKTSLKVNESLTLAGIPPEVFEYRLGNRSALDWVIDQYRATEDSRSGIVSDPNREDDPEYIVKLVGRVVAVSVETVKLVKSLPVEFGG